METYCKAYVDLALTVKRKKEELEDIKKKLKGAKERLYGAMLKSDAVDIMYYTKVKGNEEKIHIVRDKLKPKPPSKRKKQAEIREDIHAVLENYHIENADNIVKEIEQARKAKGDVAPSKNKVGYGDVIYE
jgi:hypothetical protein